MGDYLLRFVLLIWGGGREERGLAARNIVLIQVSLWQKLHHCSQLSAY